MEVPGSPFSTLVSVVRLNPVVPQAAPSGCVFAGAHRRRRTPTSWSRFTGIGRLSDDRVFIEVWPLITHHDPACIAYSRLDVISILWCVRSSRHSVLRNATSSAISWAVRAEPADAAVGPLRATRHGHRARGYPGGSPLERGWVNRAGPGPWASSGDSQERGDSFGSTIRTVAKRVAHVAVGMAVDVATMTAHPAVV